MKSKIQIRTAPGHAAKTSKKIKPFIIGMKKVKIDSYVNKKDDEIIWDIEGGSRSISKIWKNVNKFAIVMQMTLDSKLVRKTIRKKLSPEDEKKLQDMLVNQTSIKILKQEDLDVKEEYDGRTLWQRVKDTFKKEEE